MDSDNSSISMTSAEFAEIVTRFVGGEMMIVASLGLIINFFMCHHFSKLEKNSFYVLCLSKTITNSMSLLIYLCYAGPTNLLYTQLLPCKIDAYLNHILGFGLILQGPIIQLMVTINRFLVIWFSPVSIPSYSTKVTVVAIGISWVWTAWLGTLVGLPDDCRVSFGFDHVACESYSECVVELNFYQMLAIFGVAVATNSMNVLIAIKLFCMAKALKSMSSSAAKERRELSIRFFLQSCCQDWILVLDYANNQIADASCETWFCLTSWTMAVDVTVYGFDGLVMFLFNRNVDSKENSSSRKNTRSQNSVQITMT